ncbi:MAG: hypothetical protein KI790_20250 [Cyclobacteriaceae bacterium]|nr:hypothetical protein [Cyclobacteriaceae bacterium HetDA_MAG_MS6]
MSDKFPNRPGWYLLTVAALTCSLYLLTFIHHTPTKAVKSKTIRDKPLPPKLAKEKPKETITPKSVDSITTTTEQGVAFVDETSPESLTPEDQFEEMRVSYQKRVIDQLPEGRNRTDLVVRYYRHPADGNFVRALKDLRLYIHERKADAAFDKYPSNALFYGDDVPEETLRLVAYALMQEGMQIRSIQQSKYHDSWKASAIEVGVDTLAVNEAAYSLQDILNLTFSP